MKKSSTITCIALSLLTLSCTNDGYDSGDGAYSDMRADFVEAQTDGSAAIISFVTDDGDELSLTQAVKPSWTEKGDTTYRALIYYNKVETSNGTYKAQPLSLRNVLVPAVKPSIYFTEGIKTDPVTFNSAWISGSGRYLNLDISVKTGKSDDPDATQSIGIAAENISVDDDGHITATLTLYHDQASIPEYYSTTCYISIPLQRDPLTLTTGDTIILNINTYSGKVTKSFTF